MIGFRKKRLSYLESLRFPWLALITALLFLFNLFIPDALPFVDEILLGLIAALLARLKRKPEREESSDA